MHFVSDDSSLLEVKPSTFGKGLFATKDILPGVRICSVQGNIISFGQTLLLGEKESYAVQIGIDKYILCDPPFLYSNHSCYPNCGLNKYLELFTLKQVQKGEEIFWDYSTSMLERHWTMRCRCGASNCRKIITDFDILPIQLQEQYIKMNIVLPFIVDELQYGVAI